MKKYVLKIHSDTITSLSPAAQKEYSETLCKEFSGMMQVSSDDVLVVLLRTTDHMVIEEFVP